VNELRVACRETVEELQKIHLSRRLPKEESDRLVAIIRKLRQAMRRDHERQQVNAAIERLERGRSPAYPVA